MSSIGIVLSGGLAKGGYQAGFIKLLLEMQNKDDDYYICSSSVGTLNGYALASNQANYLQNVWKSIDTVGVKNFFRFMKNKDFMQGYIEHMVNIDIEKNFHLYTLCCEFPSMKEKYFCVNDVDKKDLLKVLTASITIPPIMKPVSIEDKNYIDGAFISNIPIDYLVNKNLDYIIVVHFDSMPLLLEETYKNDNIIEIQFSETEHIVSDSFDFSYHNVNEMINRGYYESKRILEKYFNNMKCDNILFKHDVKSHHLNVNGDYILNRLNKVIKNMKFT